MTSKEFTDTYLPLKDALYRVAYYLLESGTDAEDAVQDLYIKLWNSKDTLAKVCNPRSYCITLMKNLCIDRIRKASGKKSVELKDNLAETESTDNSVIRDELVQRIEKEIAGLPERQRKVLRMRVTEDLSNEEISIRTGMSNMTVRVLLSQARKKLRNTLESYSNTVQYYEKHR